MSSGTCTAVVDLDAATHHRYDMEVVDYITARLRAINDRCVSWPVHGGGGGGAYAGQYSTLPFHDLAY